MSKEAYKTAMFFKFENIAKIHNQFLFSWNIIRLNSIVFNKRYWKMWEIRLKIEDKYTSQNNQN
jgi:hypothetical protein